ncbi:AraC family transcriptional regulator [Thalassotalea sp. HSM 43]|uniref:helix-turn-helix domain-containing protein n=1 Tax=Thalassotalea sp. HSM 43 TaxID=2552945 RepID=UPI0010822075|nr:helix-turn-helix domain-containing protein [Thalassotalea sp. HSM 43]QBY04481.1 AraC family transcriptional regulator [Thalassotalea sp. HSM 43]
MKPFEFQTVLFNFHDVILIMTAIQCLFFGALLYVTNTSRLKSTWFLIAFLLAHALIPINELMMWGAEFKLQVRSQWPHLYFIPQLAYFLDGALLYLCIKSLIYKDFTLKKKDLIHLVPLLVYVVFMSSTYFSYSENVRMQMLLTESFVYSGGFVGVDLFSKIVRVIYVISCFVLISKYSSRLQDTQSNIESGHIHWLTSLVIGFMTVMLAEAVLSAVKVLSFFFTLGDGVYFYIGLTGNYASFILVNLLVFLAVRHFITFKKVSNKEPTNKPVEDPFFNPEKANEIEKAMLASKAYMDPDITLDKLAETLNIIPRDLSMLINRHYGINFYEFINKYRIEEAKKMLISPLHKDTTITDIYLDVGFNSKSVFYTFFKKFEGMTPSKYRQSVKATDKISGKLISESSG